LLVEWTDPEGVVVFTTDFESPEPLTQTHLDAISIKSTPRSSSEAAGGAKSLAASIVLVPRLRTEAELPQSALPVADWSGVRVRAQPTAVGECYIFVAAYAGQLRRDQVFVVAAGPTMTITTVMSRTGKSGDPDLYLFDPISGAMVCASDSPGNVPEDCSALAAYCSNAYVDVVVRGFGKNQRFVLLVSETEAY
jgi:hypothetical protein